MIEFRCSKCDEIVRAPAAHAGKKGRCPGCHEVLPIPESSERLEPVEFPCESCGHGMKAPGKFVGKQGKCSKCGHLMTIPADSIPIPAASAAKPAPAATPAAKPAPVAKPAAAATPVAKPAPATRPQGFSSPAPVSPFAPSAASFASASARAPNPANDPFADLGSFGAPATMAPAYGPYQSPVAPSYASPYARSDSSDPAGIVSMILGIVSLLMVFMGCVLSCVPLLGGLAGFGGFVFAAGGLVTGLFGKSGFRVAGIVMCSISVVLIVLQIALGVLFLALGLTLQEMNDSGEFGPPGDF